MSALLKTFAPLLFILSVAAGYALATNAGDYVAPTQAESDADTAKQVARICDMPGWPDNARLAYESACKREFASRAQ